MQKLRVLDLFSGIGGFSLGLERTGGFETVAFCEIEPFCRKVLAKHWPDVPIFEDVRELKADAVGPVDIIAGGFPCQDISRSGRQAGIKGSRSGLWSQIVRLAGELRPRFIVVENVRRLLSGGSGEWFGTILSDLAEIRFDAEWDCIPASFVGAPHQRDRVFLTAYQQSNPLSSNPYGLRSYLEKVHQHRGVEFWDEQKRFAKPSPWWSAVPPVPRVVDGIPTADDKRACVQYGNAVLPQIPEMIGRAILAAETNV